MKPAYAVIKKQARDTPKPLQDEVRDAVWKATHYRAQNFGECYTREGLPQVLCELLGGYHRTIRIAVAASILDRDRESGQLDLVTFSKNKSQAVIRSIIDDLPDDEVELPMPKAPWGD